MINVGIVEAASLDPSEIEAWRELADQAAEPNPFFRPEFVLAHVRARAAHVELLVARSEGRWLACLPVERYPGSREFPFPRLEVLTHKYSFCTTPLLDRGAVVDAADALIRGIRAERRAAVVRFQLLPQAGDVSRAFGEAALRRGMTLTEYPAFERGAWYRSAIPPGDHLAGSRRRELTRLARILGETLGPLELVDRSSDPEAWEAFMAMENSGWKAESGDPMAADPADAAFFRAICAGLSASGQLEVVSLDAGGRTIAMECIFVDGPTHWAFKIAHDPTFGRFSPGTQLMSRVMARFHDQGLLLADSCASPQNAHINRLWPSRRALRTVLVPTGAWSRHLVRPALAARKLARGIR